jgi:arginine N-succinyltransferase
LPEDVRRSLGEVGERSRGAVRLLEQAGMKFLNHLDPFDAGPYYGAEISELGPVKEYRALVAIIGEPSPEKRRAFMVARDDRRGFRAVRAEAAVEGSRIIVNKAVLAALSVRERGRLDVVPLP